MFAHWPSPSHPSSDILAFRRRQWSSAEERELDPITVLFFGFLVFWRSLRSKA
jgi:hypothetical protein